MSILERKSHYSSWRILFLLNSISSKNELKELNDKKDRIEDLAINGTFTKDRFQKKITEVEQELIKKEIEIENLQKDTIDIDGLLNYAQNFLKNISNLWFKT